MVKLKKIYFFLILLFLISSFNLYAEQNQSQPEFIEKFGTLAPEGTSLLVFWEKIVNYTYEKSNGRIKIINYPGGVMGDEPEIVRKMRLSQLQMAGLTVQGIYNIAPEMLVLELPFLFNDYEEVEYVRNKMFKTFAKFFEDRGFYLFSWFDPGFSRLFSKIPIYSPDDVQKQKMWSWTGEPVINETIKALGITPIPLKAPEVLPALQTGMINAIQAFPWSVVALQWYPYLNYMTTLRIKYNMGVVVISKKYQDSLPEELSNIGFEANNIYHEEILNMNKKDEMESIDGMVAEGIKLVELNPNQKDEFVKKTRIVWGKLADKIYPKTLLDEVIKHLEEYRKTRKEVSP